MKRSANGVDGRRGRRQARQQARTRVHGALASAFARLVHTNAHFHRLDTARAATKTAKDMTELNAKMADAIGERLGEIVGARHGTPLPAVLAVVAEASP